MAIKFTDQNKKPQGFDLWRYVLKPEKNFYFIIVTYACGISLLSLAIPISVQVLVNTVTFAMLLQPLVVVSLLLLSLLVFSGILRGLQDYTIEIFQRHFYARYAWFISERLLNATDKSLCDVYRGDLVNRYFEIVTVQKKMAKLLVGGISLVLQTIVGMLLLAFYHPYFLAFDILLIVLLSLVWILYGQKALDTAIYESKAKYKMAAWLEQVGTLNKFFKSHSCKEHAQERSKKGINNYLQKRKEHFHYLFRQIIFLLVIYAILSALILGLGGFLVMKGQLTLGQLVAAEIVVAVILSGFAKAGTYLESIYDLHAAHDKLTDFLVLIPEEEGDKYIEYKGNIDEAHLSFKNISFDRYRHRYDFDHTFKSGESALVKFDYDSTQSIFLKLIREDIEPTRGKIYLGETDIKNISPGYIRDEVFTISKPAIFEGTVRENITFGLDNVHSAQIMDAVEWVDLDETTSVLENGLDTLLWPKTTILDWFDMIKIAVCRAMLRKPHWVVISSLFWQMPPEWQEKVLKKFKELGVGVIICSNSQDKSSGSFDSEVSFKSGRL